MAGDNDVGESGHQEMPAASSEDDPPCRVRDGDEQRRDNDAVTQTAGGLYSLV